MANRYGRDSPVTEKRIIFFLMRVSGHMRESMPKRVVPRRIFIFVSFAEMQRRFFYIPMAFSAYKISLKGFCYEKF